MAATTYTNMTGMVNTRLASDSRLSSSVLEDAARKALKRYNKDFPRVRITAPTAGSGENYIALPSDWSPELSRVVAVEYPTGEDDPVFVGADEYFVEYVAAQTGPPIVAEGVRLRLRTVSLATTETIAVLYTAPHSISGLKTNVGDTAAATATTLATQHDEAFADLFASVACRSLMGATASTVDPNIAAEAIDQESQFNRFEKLADKFEADYLLETGLGKDKAVVAVGGWGGGWSEARRKLIFLKVCVMSRWEPSLDRYSAFLNPIVV